MTSGSSEAVLQRIGVGLWTMRTTALSPRNRVADYRGFREDAVLAEQLGFHSIWSAEHCIWYDGWRPAPLHAQASAAAVTHRLRFGNAVLLAPQHDPGVLAEVVEDVRSPTPPPGTIGTLRDLWIESDPNAARAFRRRFAQHFDEGVETLAPLLRDVLPSTRR